MTTSTSKESKSARSESKARSPGRKKKPKKGGDGARETIESIAIAFILAFLFKTFQAEAYVIPTGSMAPTLYGRHKEITCDGCGFEFALGASSEIDQGSGYLQYRIKEAYCSNCGKKVEAREAPVFNGDRIIVNKQVQSYRRFDVVVFKNPEQPHVNYIKRLVGLPNETLRIRKGDLWAQLPGDSEWKIQRKDDPQVQKDIQLTVYDDNFPARRLIDLGWPERWEPSRPGADVDSVGGWLPSENSCTPDRDGRSYKFAATEETWLRYRNFQPNSATWPRRDQVNPELPNPQAELIVDFCSFNAFDHPRSRGTYWVGDLTVSGKISVQKVDAGGKLTLELVEGPQSYQCAIDLANGTTVLSVIDGDDRSSARQIASGPSAMQGADYYDVSFANVDDRLCVWINNRLVEFDNPTEYVASDVPQPTQRDLSPVGISVSNAMVTVSDLLLERDIYYRNDVVAFDEEDGVAVPQPYRSHGNYDQINTSTHEEVQRAYDLESQLSNPEAWAKIYAEQVAAQLSSYGKYGEYKLDSDEYLMFGDNSSMSKDSRLFDYEMRPMNSIFSHRYAVREVDLIGKALYIFWPHGVPFLNDGKGIPVIHHKGMEDAKNYPKFRVPFYPNLSRMKKIR